jgi:exodeoxyribonuclease VII large subunit
MRPEPAAHPATLTVSEVARRAKDLLEQGLGRVWIEGEVSNYRKILRSGHSYFSLKDAHSQLKAAMFAGVGSRLRFEMKDGMQVLLYGKITVYEAQGEYQVVVERVEPKGVGAAQLALAQLKEKLEKEGLFDPARKRPLPFLPRRVALVTSPTSAAVRDMLTVIERRFPPMDVWVVPVAVQGADAAASMVRALDGLAALGGADVVIIGRGGGSAEDLWCFNDEALARAIAAHPAPVISAVGHEIDVTLADLIADRRALTPSEAAELAVPRLDELEERLAELGGRLKAALQEDLRTMRQRLADLGRSRGLARPQDLIERLRQRLDGLTPRMDAALRTRTERVRERLAAAGPRIGTALQLRLGRARERVAASAGRLDALSPLRVLARGYSMTRSGKTGEVLRRAAQVAPGDIVRTSLERAELESKVTKVVPKGGQGGRQG